MPTYEYECKACGSRFERFQSITAEPVKDCPECGGSVHRLIGAGAAVLSKSANPPPMPSCGQQPFCGPEAPCFGGEPPCCGPSCDL
jgi:putative FmdB family regulatory protein